MFLYKYFLTSHLGIRLERVECIVIFNEVTKMPNERENYEGIVKRGLKEEWCDSTIFALCDVLDFVKKFVELDNAISDFYAPQIEKEMFVRKAIKNG